MKWEIAIMSGFSSGGCADETRDSTAPTLPDELCDMIFGTALMADPVVAADGFTYERASIEQWLEDHNTSPTTGDELDHAMLTPNHAMRKQVAAWCDHHGRPPPVAQKRPTRKKSAGGGSSTSVPLIHKPQITCAVHADEQLLVFCDDCCRCVCVCCAVDSDFCKLHVTKALKSLKEELKADKEAWRRAHRECDQAAQQLCDAIQADGDAKVQAIIAQIASLQSTVRSIAAARSAAFGAIVQKREEREELVAGAAASPDVAVKGSPAACVIASALHRAKSAIPSSSAAVFRAEAAHAAAVGRLVVAADVVDPEDEAAAAAAAAAKAAAASAAAALGPLSSSALLRRVTDSNKVQQFGALLKTRLVGKSHRLLYTWSRDGSSVASFHRHCDDKGPTLLIVRSATGHTFGGYAAGPWHSRGAWSSHQGCFLFLVENPHGDAPTAFECRDLNHAFECGDRYGPWFGYNGESTGDIAIFPNICPQRCETKFPSSYIDTLGRGCATFTGAADGVFTLDDFEVWAIS